MIRISNLTTEIRKQTDPYYQRQKCSPGILLSGNIRFMRICVMFSWRGASNYRRMVRTGDFSNFGCHIFETFKVETNNIMQRYDVLYWLSSDFE